MLKISNNQFEYLLERVRKMGVNVLFRWMSQWLSIRSMKAKIGHRTILDLKIRTCSQEEVTSLLMWSLTIDECVCGLTELDAACQGYADNFVYEEDLRMLSGTQIK